MRIDPRSHVPIYRQIAEEIRAAVAAGIYRPGEVLPSLRAMAVEIQVNPNTVQRAYDELEREGLIYSQRGRGLFVSEQGTASAQLTAGDGVRRLLRRSDPRQPRRRHESQANPRNLPHRAGTNGQSKRFPREKRP